MDGNFVTGVLVAAAIGLGLFLLLREFWAWYFKVNEQNRLLRQILMELRQANGKANPAQPRELDDWIKDERKAEEPPAQPSDPDAGHYRRTR